MEGVLFKWTNYYSGWQPRYFVLNETAVLSYYKSSELIHEGCKGSCLVTACEVKAHPHDPLRFDLIIPGEQFFCLKAKSQHERQRWLVALGSSKSRGTKPTATPTTSNNHNSQLVSHLTSIDHELKLKVQELRLYETVLMQRIHAVKSITNDTPIPDVKKFDETTSLLSVTCDAFIQTLDECVQLATHNSTQHPLHLSPTSSINSDNVFTRRQSSRELISDPKTILSKGIVYRTFFSELRPSFSKFSTSSLNEIPSELFLTTCEQYLNLIASFNSTTLTSLSSDANENICKLREKISQNPKKFQTLYSILNDEISSQRTKEQQAIPDALLSLKRSLDFVAWFLNEFGQGDQTMEDALNKAYRHALKSFHDWTTRGLFSTAFRSVSSNEHFLRSLAVDSDDGRDVLFEQQVSNEMIEHSKHMNLILRKMNDFYTEHQLQ